MDLGGIMLSEISQRNVNTMISLICGILKKKEERKNKTKLIEKETLLFLLPEAEGEEKRNWKRVVSYKINKC